MTLNRRLPPIAARTLTAAFERILQRSPDKIGYMDYAGVTQSYAETYRVASTIGTHLARLGVAWQEPVGLMLDNSIDFLNLAYGIGLTGRIQVPINTAYKHDYLAHIINDSGIRVLIVEGRYFPRVAEIRDRLPALKHVVVRGENFPAPDGFEVSRYEDLLVPVEPQLRPVDAGDLFAIMYTSGTTGASKGVEVTHAHAYTYASREDSRQGPRADDRILVMQPMFHLAAQWYGAYQTLIAGATCIIQPAFSASKFWDWVREYQITWTGLLGAIAHILDKAEPRSDDAQNSLRFLGVTPLLAGDSFYKFADRFGVQLGTAYGSTEAGLPIFSEYPDIKPGEAGKPREGYELRIVNEEGLDQPDGVAGELWVRSESPLTIMRGYHGLPDKTADTLVDGWLRTGDVMFRDGEGRFFFVDRKKDALRRRGENISSAEVERALNSYPAILESAVVGVPSELGEDEIKAVVVRKPGHTLELEVLVRFLIERMPYFMVPRYFELRESLPKTPTQKVQKHVLRESGIGGHVWDREAAGIFVKRQ